MAEIFGKNPNDIFIERDKTGRVSAGASSGESSIWGTLTSIGGSIVDTVTGVIRTGLGVAEDFIDASVGNFFSDIGWEIRWLLLLLILILIYLIIRTYYYLKKNKKLRMFVRKEVKEAEEITHKSFDIMREDVGDTKEIKKDLNDAENLISKEIKDIEKL